MAEKSDPEELTDKRTTLLKVAAERLGTDEFPRSALNAVLYYEDNTDLIGEDDEEEEQTMKTTTRLLNKIVEEDGRLTKTQQGDGKPFVLDKYAGEDEKATGVTPGDLRTMADQILKRNGKTRDLSYIDFTDWGEVIREINDIVGKKVLDVKSTPNLYQLTDEMVEWIEDNL